MIPTNQDRRFTWWGPLLEETEGQEQELELLPVSEEEPELDEECSAVMNRKEVVLIIDFGGSEAQLLARRVRELEVYAELVPYSMPLTDMLERKPQGIILFGRVRPDMAASAPSIDPAVFELGIPILGIGYGHQLMAHLLGAKLTSHQGNEHDRRLLAVDQAQGILTGWESEEPCWLGLGAQVETPPSGFAVLAHTGNAPVAAMGDGKRHLYGVQFHPEMDQTTKGPLLLRSFLFDICGLSGGWNMGMFAEDAMASIRNQVGDGQLICGLSGGVDSSVAATLVHQAVGDQLTSIFVDNGLLRQGEPEQVVSTFRQRGLKVVYADARERFLTRLAGVADPEKNAKLSAKSSSVCLRKKQRA